MPSSVVTSLVGRCLVTAALAVFAGCSGDGGSRSQSGALSLNAQWEAADRSQPRRLATIDQAFTPADEIPERVTVVEVRVTDAAQVVHRVFIFNPRDNRSVDITELPPGPAIVEVLGYDFSFLPSGSGDDEARALLEQFALPPSYASDPITVQIVPGELTDAGTIDVLARPFVTGFVPLPGESNVPRDTPVFFAFATDRGDIARDSVEISVNGLPVVVAGVEAEGALLNLCDDSAPDLLCFSYNPSAPFAPGERIEVEASASVRLGAEGVRSIEEFQYFFDTTSETLPATATPTEVGPATETPTEIEGTATESPTETATPLPTSTATEVPTATEE
ncbi:MAG TPA: hypothetical protein VEB21_04615, partial [Terriglobales bacterium]|nr:hypothetical protein [Terriglobales bacterium]